MRRRLSRRAFLTTAGAGILAAASAASWVTSRGCRPVSRRATNAPFADYVDHEGWMLTADDKQKLVGTPGRP